jgi:hypothetical protein
VPHVGLRMGTKSLPPSYKTEDGELENAVPPSSDHSSGAVLPFFLFSSLLSPFAEINPPSHRVSLSHQPDDHLPAHLTDRHPCHTAFMFVSRRLWLHAGRPPGSPPGLLGSPVTPFGHLDSHAEKIKPSQHAITACLSYSRLALRYARQK